MATLAVQEAMGLKVDREAVATLVLPQLWTMSIGPRKHLPIPPPKIFVFTHLIFLDSAKCPTIPAVYGCYQEARGPCREGAQPVLA